MKTSLLLKMSEEIDEAELELARLDGKIDGMMERLKRKVGYSDLSKAKGVLSKIKKKITMKEKELETGIKNMEKKYKWEKIK